MSYIHNDTEYSVADITRNFLNSWAVVKKHGLGEFRDFGSNEFAFRTGNGITILPKHEFVILHDFPRVDVMFNYKKSCALIGRTPNRQWVVGYTPSNLLCSTPFGRLQEEYSGASFIHTIFNPTYVEIDKIYKSVAKDTSVSLAFNEKYWLTCPDGKNVELWRKMIKVGTITQEKPSVYTLELDGFCYSMEQELKDEVKNVSFNIVKSV